MCRYLALAECRDGLLGSLKVMYRQTQDTDIQKALMQIIECMEADAGDEDIAELIRKMELETAVSGIQDIAKESGVSVATVSRIRLCLPCGVSVCLPALDHILRCSQRL